MATVRLSDVIVPQVFNRYMVKDTMEKSRIFQSGIIASDPMLSSFLSGGGLTVQSPFWRDLDDTEPGIANDDPASIATPGKIGTAQTVAIRNVRTRGWQTAELVADLAGSDPMARIRSRVSAYWERAFERHLISTLVGVFADNAANDGSDMRVVIGADAAGAPSAANLISAEAILDAKQTMGDSADGLSMIIMHSVVFTRLQKNNLIDYIPDSEGRVRFPTYLGYNVIVDDSVRVVQGTTNTQRFLYSTYLAGAGAIRWGESSVDVPVEVFRNPDQGNGRGVETLWTRRQYILQPDGFAWTDSSRAGQFPTNAECQNAVNWDRRAPERKQIQLAELVTN